MLYTVKIPGGYITSTGTTPYIASSLATSSFYVASLWQKERGGEVVGIDHNGNEIILEKKMMDYSQIRPKKWAGVIQYFHDGEVVGVHDRHPPRRTKKLTRKEFEQQLEQQIINRNNHG